MTTGDLVELPGTDATRAFVRARARVPVRARRRRAGARGDGVYALAAGVAGLVAPLAHREWKDGG